MHIWFGIDSLQASVRVDIKCLRDLAHWFGIDSLQASVLLTLIAGQIAPIGLSLIVYKNVSEF